VIHLHGEVTKVRPQDSYTWEDGYSEKQVVDVGYGKVSLGDKSPKGVQLRPHIVFFGEQVPKIEEAANVVAQADILLIVGTSMQVYPAASLYTFARTDCPIYLIDPASVSVRDRRIVHIRETATQGMQTFIANYL